MNNLSEEQLGLVQQIINQVSISSILDSACNGALEDLQDQLREIDADAELIQIAEDVIFNDHISIG